MTKYHLWIPLMESLMPLAGYAGVFDTWEDVQQFIAKHSETEVHFYVCKTESDGRLVYHAKYNTLRDNAAVMLPPGWRPSIDD